MLRGVALTLVAVLGACSGRSEQNDSMGAGGGAGASSAGSSGAVAKAGTGSAMAGTGFTSGGNEIGGTSGVAEGGDTSSGAEGGVPAAGSAAGGADGEAGAPTGEGGAGALECPSGCEAGSEPFCEGDGVTWVCFGPGPIDYQALLDGGCTDLATQVPRYCCPASFHPECQ